MDYMFPLISYVKKYLFALLSTTSNRGTPKIPTNGKYLRKFSKSKNIFLPCCQLPQKGATPKIPTNSKKHSKDKSKKPNICFP